MAHEAHSMAPSFSDRKIEDFARCKMGAFQLWIRNAGEKLSIFLRLLLHSCVYEFFVRAMTYVGDDSRRTS